jgi:putative phosphoesterase
MIGVISDVHGNLPALEAVLADLRVRSVSDIVNLGDHVSGPLWPRETAEVLQSQPWIQISGNHDRQVALDDPATHGASDRYAFAELSGQQTAWLRDRPATARHSAGLLLCHGTPASDLEFLLEAVAHERLELLGQAAIARNLGAASAEVVCCGHSHMPRTVRAGQTLIVNPGSVGLQAFRDGGPPAYRSETGAPQARYAILDRRDGQWTVQHLAVGYDHERAAQRAATNGAPEWAHALRTGFATRE